MRTNQSNGLEEERIYRHCKHSLKRAAMNRNGKLERSEEDVPKRELGNKVAPLENKVAQRSILLQ
jgi:hypothetical protein